MEKLKGGIFITPKDIQILNNCSLRNAQREHLIVRKELDVSLHKLTVEAYCTYWKLNYEIVIGYLNPYR